MAIAKMKHLRLIAMQNDREALLRLLQRMGCVEIVEPSEADADGLAHPDPSGLAAARERCTAVERALGVLKRCAPQKTKFLEPRPGVTEAELFDDRAAQEALAAVEEINDADRRLNAIQSERAKLLAQKATLAPWLTLDLPLDTESTPQVTIQLGTLPAGVPFEQAEGVVLAEGELAQLTQVSKGPDQQYLLLVCHAAQSGAVLDQLKTMGWARAGLRDFNGTAAENNARLDQELARLDQEAGELEQKLAGMGGVTQTLKRLADRSAVEVSREENRGRMLDSGKACFLEGWVQADRWPELEKALTPYACACEVTDPDPEDYPNVPVQLKNGWFTKPLNMVTDMYSLPAYGTVDPNPLMAPFFILFYGMMMADMGYGLLMMIASVVIVKKKKPHGATMRYMFPLLGLCGVSTFLWGAVTGGFFGDFLTQLVKLTTGGDFALPALFSPVDDALAVLIGSLVLGLAQIFTGMAVSVYRKVKRGDIMDALCNEGAWYMVFILAGVAAVTGLVKPIVIAIIVLLVLTQSYGKKGIMGKLLGIGGSLYNNITGYFSDILSYSRLMALMLAGAVVAQVFNTLGAITNFVPTFILISIIGNALNFALNLLGCYVHDMRLQCLEYFKYYYEDGGKPFQPLELNTTYYEVVK